MPIFQSYNSRIKRYVKGEVVTKKDGSSYFKATDVKQREPKKPFKNVPIKRRR